MINIQIDQLRLQVETSQQESAPARGKVNTKGMSKVDARRVQILVRQREALEKELEILQRDVEELVRSHTKTPTITIYAY